MGGGNAANVLFLQHSLIFNGKRVLCDTLTYYSEWHGKCNFFLLKSEKNKGYMKIAQNSGKVIDAEGKLLYNELDILEK